jgi:8-oxo-dGTP pyrophosphatase MutT (NUDIX family)
MKASRNNKTIEGTGTQHLLQQLAAMPEKFAAGRFRTQYAALCFRRLFGESSVEVLLITSRGTGRWVIPKGWPMKKKKPHEAAEIEAWEEAGVRGVARKKSVGRYTYLKWLENGDVAPCVVEVFQIEVQDLVKDFKERGQRRIAWVSLEEAARRVREVELKSLLVNFKPKIKD